MVVCVAYSGERYKSRLQVTRCLGGWPKGLESGFGLLPRQLLGAELILVVCMTRMCLAIWLSIILLVTVSDGSFVEKDLMVVSTKSPY